MNAYEIIQSVVEEEMMKHLLYFSPQKCACGQWKVPKGKQHGTLGHQHARHVAEIVAARLTNSGELRKAVA